MTLKRFQALQNLAIAQGLNIQTITVQDFMVFASSYSSTKTEDLQNV